MANTKSAKKNVRKMKKRQQVNASRRSTVKTSVKKVLTAISDNEDISKIKELMKQAEAQLSRAKNKILHKSAASRKISRLAKKVSDYTKSKK